MKRRSLFLAGLIAAPTAVLANPVNSPPPSQLPFLNIPALIADDASHGGSRAVTTNYDNWTNPASLLTGIYNNGTHEIADDLGLVGVTGVGLLDTMGFNVANSNAPGGLVTGSGAVRFYDLISGAFISGFNFNLPTFAPSLAAGGSSRLSFAAGALRGLNIFLPATGVYCSLQYTAATFDGAGGALANIGIQTRGPINSGTSTDNLYDVTAGGTAFNFGGNPRADTGLFIKTDSVPEPASLVLIGLGVIGWLRRR